MCREDELAIGKRRYQRTDKTALPSRVQVEISFVDQYNRLSDKWVLYVRIGDSHASGQISDHRKCTFLPVGELIDKYLLLMFIHNHSQGRSTHSQIPETWQKSFDGSSNGFQLRIAKSALVQTVFVFQILAFPEPLEEYSEIARTSRQRLIVC